MTASVATLRAASAAPARAPRPHVAVCICTSRRPALLQRLLAALAEQRTDGRFTYSIIISDHDRLESARPVASTFATLTTVPTVYCSEPEQNDALARNRAVAAATGDYIAFLEDDEFPVPDWLRLMLETCERTEAAGVLGPVRPYFDTPPPRWVVMGGFCTRPEHPTGTFMPWSWCRTGNLLVRRSLVAGKPEPFRSQSGRGGEDSGLFAHLASTGAVLVWCNEAIAYQRVPPSRCTRRYVLRRALRCGRDPQQLRHGRLNALATSLVAISGYALLLPPSTIFGHHVFMRFCARLCHHLGRLFAVCFVPPAGHRPGVASPC